MLRLWLMSSVTIVAVLVTALHEVSSTRTSYHWDFVISWSEGRGFELWFWQSMFFSRTLLEVDFVH